MVELENVYITLKDGRSLSARVWLSDDTDFTPVPAILEFLPYRKRDGTAARDESTYPVFGWTLPVQVSLVAYLMTSIPPWNMPTPWKLLTG
jgi:predicted acyl esterase